MKTKLQTLFGNKRIIGLAGEKSSGKTNNLIHLLIEFRKHNKTTPICAFGLPDVLNPLLQKLDIKLIGSIRHLINKKNCILVLDEFQKLKLNDRRYKDALQEFIDFVYHRNVYVILSSPDIREFNSIIGGIVEKWLLKTVRIDQCINGSQLKNVIDEYKGKHKELGNIVTAKNEIVVINDFEDTTMICDYEEEADTKKGQVNVLQKDKKLTEEKTK